MLPKFTNAAIPYRLALLSSSKVQRLVHPIPLCDQDAQNWPTGSASREGLAHIEGSCGVVADVVETLWTGGETRDVVRHCGAWSSAHAGLHGRSGPPWMGASLLITQRSQVQILPPLPRSEAGSEHGSGLLYVPCQRIWAQRHQVSIKSVRLS